MSCRVARRFERDNFLFVFADLEIISADNELTVKSLMKMQIITYVKWLETLEKSIDFD